MSETDMTDYAELLRHLRLLARGKHDDVSIAADAAGAIIALLRERDALVSRSPSYDALLVISQSVAAALERAGVEECDDPGEAIDLLAQSARAPDGLVDRIDSAIQRIVDNHAPRRIPADPSDVDLVLAEVKTWINGNWPPFWISDRRTDDAAMDGRKGKK